MVDTVSRNLGLQFEAYTQLSLCDAGIKPDTCDKLLALHPEKRSEDQRHT